MNPKMRLFVVNQIQEFRRNDCSTVCEMCREPLPSNYHVDHAIPLKQLVYLYDQSFSPRVLDDEYNYYAGWREFHARHAKLRKTCPDCNLRRPKWKPDSATCAICNMVEVLSPSGACYPCETRHT